MALPEPTRPSRTLWRVVFFLLGFTAILLLAWFYFLVPAMDAARTASPVEKRSLSAFSRLVLAVVLFVLFAGLVLTFRVGRFFFPRRPSPRVKTEYTDAWAEAGRRMELPDEEEPKEPRPGER